MLETINKMVWGDFLLFLLLGTGLMLSLRFKFFQIFKIRYIFKNTILTLFNKKNSVNSSDKESISVSDICNCSCCYNGYGKHRRRSYCTHYRRCWSNILDVDICNFRYGSGLR